MALVKRFPVVHRSAASLAFVLFCIGASGCVRTVQAWPPPLAVENLVTVSFTSPRNITFDGDSRPDSAIAVRELHGRVVSLHGATLVVRVTRALDGAAGGRIVGRPATVLLDSGTRVTRSETDGWKVGYGILATAVLIFAGLVMSGG